MFCSNCGHKIPDLAHFCPSCGRMLNRRTDQAPVLCVPVNINTSLTRTEPSLLYLDSQRCFLLRINLLTMPDFQARDNIQAQLALARQAAMRPASVLLQDFPGSLAWSLSQVRELAVTTWYDADFHRPMAYDRFSLQTDTGHQRGSIASVVDIASCRPVLQQLLGHRFHIKEMVHSFDD